VADKDLSRQELDLYYFDKWRKNGRKEDFQKLYRGFHDIISSASRKASMGSNIPQSVFKLQAAQQFHDSLNTFDPSRGASLKTHIWNGVENKLKRINYKYGNLARIPERSGNTLGVYDINVLNNTEELLRQKLNREPTIDEIATDMGVRPDQVEGLKKEIRKDLSLNADLEELTQFDENATDEDVMHMLYYDMNPQQKLLYDYTNGKHGKQAILKPSGKPDFNAIARKMGISNDQVQKIRKQLVKMIIDSKV
jgi:DNA-directed RNA polymerase sigma subunit (sigma70/sigma32)